MEENPYKASTPDTLASGRTRASRLLAAFCIAVACVRAIMWFIGGMRVLMVAEGRENLLAVIAFIVWPGLAVIDWGATAMAIRGNRRALAILGLGLGVCDLVALAFIEPPIAM